MNIERIKHLRTVIDALEPERIAMEHVAARYGPDGVFHRTIHAADLGKTCNSAGCIAGWTIATWPELAPKDWGEIDAARDILELDPDQQSELFCASGCELFLDDIAKPHVLSMLDMMIEGEAIDWAKAVIRSGVPVPGYDPEADEYAPRDTYPHS